MSYPIEIDDWIIRLARNMTRTKPWLVEDLAQEGRTAAWSAWNGHNMPEDEGYAKGAARRRMMQVVMEKRRMLGNENGREKIVPTLPSDPHWYQEDEKGHESEEFADYVMLCYHHGEIHRAVDELPTAQRLAARKRMHDVPFTAQDKSAWRFARPKLQIRLQHLSDCG